MARRSAFVIVLSGEERAELERRVACYTLPNKVVQRAKIILYTAEGQSNVEAGQNSSQTQTTTTVRTLSATELAGEPGYYLIIAAKLRSSLRIG